MGGFGGGNPFGGFLQQPGAASVNTFICGSIAFFKEEV
jgi:hypothetical protein